MALSLANHTGHALSTLSISEVGRQPTRTRKGLGCWWEVYVVENRQLTGITLVEVLSRIEKETNGELVAVVADAEDVPSSIAEDIVVEVKWRLWCCATASAGKCCPFKYLKYQQTHHSHIHLTLFLSSSPQCPCIMDPFDALLKLVDQLRNDQPLALQQTCQQILDHPLASFGLRAIASDLLVRWESRKGVSQICTDEDLLILDQRMDKIRTELQGKYQCVCFNAYNTVGDSIASD